MDNKGHLNKVYAEKPCNEYESYDKDLCIVLYF